MEGPPTRRKQFTDCRLKKSRVFLSFFFLFNAWEGCHFKMIILAIDPGLRNLAWCLTENGVVKDINKADIFCGNAIQTCDAFHAISHFCDRMSIHFEAADLVVIERQFVDNKIKLSSCLSIVQTVLQCRSYGKHVLVHAATIKKVFSTHRGTHKLNKLAAVEQATALNPLLFNSLSGKVDDLADAFLLAWYGWSHLRYKFKQPKFPKPGVWESNVGTYQSLSSRGVAANEGVAVAGRELATGGSKEPIHDRREGEARGSGRGVRGVQQGGAENMGVVEQSSDAGRGGAECQV